MHIFSKNPRFFFSILPNKEPFKSLRFLYFCTNKKPSGTGGWFFCYFFLIRSQYSWVCCSSLLSPGM